MQPAKKNTLSFGVVNAPVGVCSAAKSDSYGGLKMVAPFQKDKDGRPPARATAVRQVYLDPTKVRFSKVEKEDIVPVSALFTKSDLDGYRAVERGKDPNTGEAVLQPIDAEAYDGLAERLDSMELLGFVPAKDAEPYYERVYDAHYLQPQNGTPSKPLGLIAKAMRLEKVVGVVKFSVGAREREGIVRVRPDGSLVVLSLRFADRWKEPDEAVLSVAEVPVERREIDLARDLVKALSVDASLLDDLRDESKAKQQEVIDKVLAGAAPAADGKPSKGPDTDLMDLLAASVEATKKGRKKVAA